jgi:hypothetical protein
MKDLQKEGYTRAQIIKENDNDYLYGHIVTPTNHILYIQYEYMIGGFTVSLCYVPSKSNGSSCNPRSSLQSFNAELSLQWQKGEVMGCLQFAKQLKVTFYENIDTFFNNQWNKQDYIQII